MAVTADIDPTDNTQVTVDAVWRFKDLVTSIAGTSYDKTRNLWVMPLSWTGCLALRGVFRDELIIGEALNEWAMNYRATVVAPAMVLRTATDAEGPDFLFPHQRADVQFMALARRAILGSEMGVGKTASAVRTWAELFRRGENPFPVLVVCPNSVKSTWKREIDKFWPGLTVTLIKGTANQRRKQLETPSHVWVINVEAVRSHSRLAPYGSVALKRCPEHGGEDDKVTDRACQVHEREFNQMAFQTVVVDECHRLKDPKSQQTRAVWSATGDAPFRFGLTGTPIADAPDDLWPVLHWLLPEDYPAKTRWMERMVDMMYNAYGGVVVSGIKAEVLDEFYAGFDPRFRRMTKAAVLQHLPPVMRERRDVEMPVKQGRAYRQMRDTLVAELDEGLLTAPSRIQQTLRLLQFASAYGEVELTTVPDRDHNCDDKQCVENGLNIEDPDHLLKTITHLNLLEPSNKVEAFMEDLPDYGEASVAVFAVSKQLINLLSKALEKAKIEHVLLTGDQDTDQRNEAEERFQAGKVQFILATIAAGGTGITLSKASIAVYLQRSWSLIEMEQAYARTHRIGSEQHDYITIIDYVTPDTVEESVFESLDRKTDRFQEIVRDADLLRRIIYKPDLNQWDQP